MKKILALFLSVFLLLSAVRADEGMWLLSLIGKNYQQMKKLGFKLTPEDIYSINHASMKDAVAALNHGMCTMELISPNGLLLTNHHCAFNSLQKISTVQNNYLKNGFWAQTYQQEIPIPGLTAWFLVKMEDVTKQILSQVNDNMTEEERDAIIRKVSQQIVKRATKGTDLVGEVKSMFDGNQYFLFLYRVYKDIRLVAAPPEAIGKFGGDMDNWMWPRHTGDFSLFRVYTAPDGSPAEYSPKNVPLKSKYYFPISLKGYHEGSYAQIIGFPGSTDRYLTTWEVRRVMHHENAIRIEVRGLKLSILHKYMVLNPKLNLMYAAKYAESSNYYKYSIGQNRDLKRLKVIKEKRRIQREIKHWINQNPERKKKYGQAFKLIKNALHQSADIDIAMNYWFEALYLGPEIIREGLHLYPLLNAESDSAKQAEIQNLKEYADEFFKNYSAQVDQDLFVHLVGLYLKRVKSNFYPSILPKMIKQYGSLQNYANYLYNNSFLTDKDKFLKAIETDSVAQILQDPGFQFVQSVISEYRALWTLQKPFSDELAHGRRLYMAAYMKMMKEKDPNYLFYPDANSTERLTYGTVEGYTYKGPAPKGFFRTTDSYDPKTGHFKYYTVIQSYLVKEKHYKNTPYADQFIVPEKLKKLIENKDFGPYADPSDHTIHTCFLTNNDITGGNSGSPVINGKGQLIGVAFDGNWESMSGDIQYDPKLQRTICVDIRFILFLIDKYGNDHRLIKEMKIID